MPISPVVATIRQRGVSLFELIIFILVVGLASGALFKTLGYSAMHSADPIAKVRAMELAQSKLDEVLALKYDENTPTGDIPACGSSDPGAVACSNNSADGIVNDVDDYNGASDTPYVGYTRNVTVTLDGNKKLIQVEVTTPQGLVFTLAAYRANF